MKTLRRQVEAHGGCLVVEAHAGVGFNGGKLAGQLRGHYGGFAHGKAGNATIGPGQGQLQRSRASPAFGRGGGQHGAQGGFVQREGPGPGERGRQRGYGRRRAGFGIDPEKGSSLLGVGTGRQAQRGHGQGTGPAQVAANSHQAG